MERAADEDVVAPARGITLRYHAKSSVGKIESAAAITCTQTGLAPGNADGAAVALRTRSGSDMNESVMATFEEMDISRTRPLLCRA